jgi:hypothetical protein
VLPQRRAHKGCAGRLHSGITRADALCHFDPGAASQHLKIVVLKKFLLQRLLQRLPRLSWCRPAELANACVQGLRHHVFDGRGPHRWERWPIAAHGCCRWWWDRRHGLKVSVGLCVTAKEPLAWLVRRPGAPGALVDTHRCNQKDTAGPVWLAEKDIGLLLGSHTSDPHISDVKVTTWCDRTLSLLLGAKVKAPRKLGGYFRNGAEHRDFTLIGTAAGRRLQTGCRMSSGRALTWLQNHRAFTWIRTHQSVGPAAFVMAPLECNGPPRCRAGNRVFGANGRPAAGHRAGQLIPGHGPHLAWLLSFMHRGGHAPFSGSLQGAGLPRLVVITTLERQGASLYGPGGWQDNVAAAAVAPEARRGLPSVLSFLSMTCCPAPGFRARHPTPGAPSWESTANLGCTPTTLPAMARTISTTFGSCPYSWLWAAWVGCLGRCSSGSTCRWCGCGQSTFRHHALGAAWRRWGAPSAFRRLSSICASQACMQSEPFSGFELPHSWDCLLDCDLWCTHGLLLRLGPRA